MEKKFGFVSLIIRNGAIRAIPGETPCGVCLDDYMENVIYVDSFALASLVADSLNHTFEGAEVLLD